MFKVVRLEEPILCYKIQVWRYWDTDIFWSERDPRNDLVYSEDS